MIASRHLLGCAAALAVVLAPGARAQVIEYEANGLKYQTETIKGLTVIVTHLPNHVAGFGMIQVSVANGSKLYWTVKPESFAYVHPEITIAALPANQVVDMLLDKSSHADVVKLVTSYENSLYAIPNMRSSQNGYEQRRQNSMSYGMPTRLKAAATASAIALGMVRLQPGESTDGAVFFPIGKDAKLMMGGRITFVCDGQTFEFNAE